MFTYPIQCIEFPHFLRNYFYFIYCSVDVINNAKIDLGMI